MPGPKDQPAAGETAGSKAPTSAAPAPGAATTTLPSTSAAGPIPADENPIPDIDTGSAQGGDAASSTASISSSILKYRTLHGRTYHSEQGNAKYWGSNDEQQNETMDILGHLMTLTMDGRLYLAPLEPEKLQKVLDIGTGTGLWAVDFAEEHPNCEVIGTDISPIQPGWAPPNVKFEIEDCTQDWTFPSNAFDYVHIRYLVGSIADWPALFNQAHNVLKSGAWLESYDGTPVLETDDDTLGENMAKWGTFFVEGGKKIERSFTVLEDGTQRKAMEEAGFLDIQEWDFKVPLGRWPKDEKLKEIGAFGHMAVMSDTEGFVLFMANVLGWSQEEIQVYIAHLRREFNSGKHHPYFRVKCVWGRKK